MRNKRRVGGRKIKGVEVNRENAKVENAAGSRMQTIAHAKEAANKNGTMTSEEKLSCRARGE